MPRKHEYDISYVTVDSLTEGVGSSQIVPLMKQIASAGLSINLISFEKERTPHSIESELESAGITWNRRELEPLAGLAGSWKSVGKFQKLDLSMQEVTFRPLQRLCREEHQSSGMCEVFGLSKKHSLNKRLSKKDS
jgi:hypothetical protein